MVRQVQSDLKWVELDIETLGADMQEAYRSYKQAYAEMKAIRKGFEDSMQSYAPDGKRLVFGYNFGKLSIAVTEAAPEKPKAQGKQSLGDYLKGMQATGRRGVMHDAHVKAYRWWLIRIGEALGYRTR